MHAPAVITRLTTRSAPPSIHADDITAKQRRQSTLCSTPSTPARCPRQALHTLLAEPPLLASSDSRPSAWQAKRRRRRTYCCGRDGRRELIHRAAQLRLSTVCVCGTPLSPAFHSLSSLTAQQHKHRAPIGVADRRRAVGVAESAFARVAGRATVGEPLLHQSDLSRSRPRVPRAHRPRCASERSPPAACGSYWPLSRRRFVRRLWPLAAAN